MDKEAKAGNARGVMGEVVGRFEDIAVLLLMGLLMVVVAISTVELGWLLFKDLTTPGTLLVDVEEMLELFGFFLLVLVGLELLTTLKKQRSEEPLRRIVWSGSRG